MAKKFCLLYFPFVPSHSSQLGVGGGGEAMLIVTRGNP